MKEPLSPCKDCNNRFLGCHSSCERYLDYKSEHDKFKQKVFAAKEEDWALNEVEQKRFEKWEKFKVRNEKQRGGF